MHTAVTGIECSHLPQGDVEEMMKVYLGAVFMPHGLGHQLGLSLPVFARAALI